MIERQIFDGKCRDLTVLFIFCVSDEKCAVFDVLVSIRIAPFVVAPEDRRRIEAVAQEIDFLKRVPSHGDRQRIAVCGGKGCAASVAHIEDKIGKPIRKNARVKLAVGSGEIGFAKACPRFSAVLGNALCKARVVAGKYCVSLAVLRSSNAGKGCWDSITVS